MKVLVVGGGGREHALVWKLAQSPKVNQVYCAPGNAGIGQIAQTVSIKAEDMEGICRFVQEENIDLTVIGPEMPLSMGLADRLQKMGRKVFGPSQKAAQIEGSKKFAKDLMLKYGIPTAKYATFTKSADAIACIKDWGVPIVIKADGLAAGKGVIVAMTEEEAIAAVKDMLEDGSFGGAGARVVIEEFLQGEEVSILAFTDGKTVVPMVSAQDHKRALDGDQGLNTGGMGAYSPAPIYTEQMATMVEKDILQKTVDAMRIEGYLYQGVLYAGLMITKDGIKVLEFNARFGDPETQPVLMRLKTDLVDIIDSILNGTLAQQKIEWSEKAAVCVVMASGGYPGHYEKGKIITGLEEAASLAQVFHAGTALQNGHIVTDGGRVLGVTAMGDTIRAAIHTVYEAVKKIDFADCHYRKDIGYRALQKQ